jgi:hypothetical protein
MDINKIAETAHEVCRVYCKYLGDDSQKSWGQSPQWQRDSALKGVKFSLENNATPEDSHKSWLKEKYDTGWVYGQTKDAERKTHPCILEYADLPEDQKVKDKFFVAIVNVFKEGNP